MSAIADVHFLPQTQFAQLESRFDEEYGVFWALMNPRFGSFNPQFLSEVRNFIGGIVDSRGMMHRKGQHQSIKYVVLASKIPAYLVSVATSRYFGARLFTKIAPNSYDMESSVLVIYCLGIATSICR